MNLVYFPPWKVQTIQWYVYMSLYYIPIQTNIFISIQTSSGPISQYNLFRVYLYYISIDSLQGLIGCLLISSLKCPLNFFIDRNLLRIYCIYIQPPPRNLVYIVDAEPLSVCPPSPPPPPPHTHTHANLISCIKLLPLLAK